MAIFKHKTLEGFITFWLTIFSGIWVVLVCLLLWQLEFNTWIITFVAVLAVFGSTVAITYFRNKVLAVFNRSLRHLEAVRVEDYKQYAKPVFAQGVVGEFNQQLREFSRQLSRKKQRYDQHVFLVYQLIDQLDTPILVFNHNNQLTYANAAFSTLYDQPWQMYRHASPKLLGLNKQKEGWQIKNTNLQQKQQWQINQSSFIDDGAAHQLLIFINIESALRSSQIDAWRKIINVMGHEIRNSLTPVSTIAESLAARVESSRDRAALALISDRCLHLQDFINRYAILSKEIRLSCQKISATEMIQQLNGLFTKVELEPAVKTQWLWADKPLLEQVLINLIKNAEEAGAQKITLDLSEDKNNTIIKVVDDGQGFSNMENLFVPLFTTKQGGQGLGLSFCRNVIEQHQGTMTLLNNRIQGTTVTIRLPLKTVSAKGNIDPSASAI